MQSEFTALQGTIHEKQKFEQTRIFKLNKYLIKMARVQIEYYRNHKKLYMKKDYKNITFKNQSEDNFQGQVAKQSMKFDKP